MITVETYIESSEVLDKLKEKDIVNYCYNKKFITPPEDYKPTDIDTGFYIDVEVEETECLDEMWESDITDYVKKNNLLETYDDVIDKLEVNDLIAECISKIKRTNKSVITKEDVLNFLTDKIRYEL